MNLIGEHVDYNDGLVLPFAIDRSVMCAWALWEGIESRAGDEETYVEGAPTSTLHVYSLENHNEYVLSTIAPDAHEWDQARDGDWVDYPTGVVWALVNGGFGSALRATQMVIGGDVPQGAGLSSSAALEVAVAGALRDASGLPVSDVELAKLCQRAENEFVGVQSGIMDQFAATLSKRGHALLIDCRTLAFRHVPLRLEGHGIAIVIANSGVDRQLMSSAYNERRRECEEAAALLQQRLGRQIPSLRDVSSDEVEQTGLPETLHRRARHVVSEIARVAAAVVALERDDYEELGRLMVESHLSLREDYEVSSEQLDLLAGLATAQEYVLGARLTGAGFGGCTVNLVQAEAVDAFARDVMAPYRERTGLPAVMYVTAPGDGLRTWRLT